MNVCTVTTQLPLYTGVDNQTDVVPQEAVAGKCLSECVCVHTCTCTVTMTIVQKLEWREGCKMVMACTCMMIAPLMIPMQVLQLLWNNVPIQLMSMCAHVHYTSTGLDPVLMLSIIQDLEMRLMHVEQMLGIHVVSQSLITYPTAVRDQSQVMVLFLRLLHDNFDVLINQLPASLPMLPSQATMNGMPVLINGRMRGLKKISLRDCARCFFVCISHE